MSGPDTSSTRRSSAFLFLAVGVPLSFASVAMDAQEPLLPDTPLTVAHAASQTGIEAAPKPAQITCEHGMMSIAAENSTLGSILAGVQTCLGVKIDVPPESAAQRFYIKSGPSPVRAKLDEVLSATGLNYVIEEGPSLPYRVQSVMLMSRSVDVDDPKTLQESAMGHTMTPARRAWRASQEAARDGRTADADSSLSSSVEAAPAKPSEGVPVDAKSVNDAGPQSEGLKSESTGLEENKEKDVLSSQNPVPAARSSAGPSTTPSANETPAAIGETDAPVVPNAATPDVAQQTPSQGSESSTDPKQTGTPAQSEFQNKVDQMQKMFEERKAMTSSSTPTPAPD